MGSNGCLVKVHNTVGKSQLGKSGLTDGFELKIPFIKSDKLFSEPSKLLVQPLWIVAIAALYPVIVHYGQRGSHILPRRCVNPFRDTPSRLNHEAYILIMYSYEC